MDRRSLRCSLHARSSEPFVSEGIPHRRWVAKRSTALSVVTRLISFKALEPLFYFLYNDASISLPKKANLIIDV